MMHTSRKPRKSEIAKEVNHNIENQFVSIWREQGNISFNTTRFSLQNRISRISQFMSY